MKRLSPLSLLVPTAFLCLALVAGEVWLLIRSRAEAAQALSAMKQKKQERDSLACQSPALSPENEAAITADLTAAERSLAEWRLGLQGEEIVVPAARPPARSIDAFFELTDFIGQLHAKAREAQVGLRPDEHFGFAVYANEGPAVEQIATIHRQRLAIQYLVEALLESRPLALLAVRRERPGADVEREPRIRADDFFELNRDLAVRHPGLIESEAFRLEFTGQTGALRLFLNHLSTGHQPVVVRSVEVAPLVADSLTRLSTQALASGAPVPLVKPGIMKFGVILELARLATNPAAVP